LFAICSYFAFVKFLRGNHPLGICCALFIVDDTIRIALIDIQAVGYSIDDGLAICRSIDDNDIFN
jgi:hypothetical protein